MGLGLRTKPHSPGGRARAGSQDGFSPAPQEYLRSVSGRFREYCIPTAPFLWVWLGEVGTLGGSEHEDSLSKQKKNYNLCYMRTAERRGPADSNQCLRGCAQPLAPKHERREEEARRWRPHQRCPQPLSTAISWGWGRAGGMEEGRRRDGGGQEGVRRLGVRTGQGRRGAWVSMRALGRADPHQTHGLTFQPSLSNIWLGIVFF